MGKHLPPPKNKHLGQSSKRKPAAPEAVKTKQEKIVCEYEFSAVDIITVLAAAALLVLVWFLPLEGWLRVCAIAVPALLAGFEVIRVAIVKMLDMDFVQEDTLIVLAAIGAFSVGHQVSAAAVLILYRLGKLFEAFVLLKSKNADTEFSDIRAVSANVETENGVVSLRPSQVQPGDIVIVAPGEIIPLDGIITEGITTIDLSPLTGHSSTAPAAEGCRAVSGCVNLTNYIKIEATASFGESTAVRIMELLEKPVGYKSKQENLAARFSRLYTPAVALAALIIGLIPPLFNGQWAEWIQKAVVFLLASGAGAIAVSVPLAYIGGLRSSARCGIVLKGTNFLEYLSKTEIMIFVKTGVITEGRYKISDVFPEGVSEEALIAAAGEAERFSKHPIARALREAAGVRAEEERVIQVEELPGKGISAFIGKRHVYVGTAALLEEHGIRYTVPTRPGAAIHVAVDNCYWGHIIVNDKVREGAFDALEEIRHQGVHNMVMLTGDVRAVARPIASSLNFDMVKAELPPEGKVSAVEYLMATRADNAALAFVGDGDAEAEALSRADVGIAMGALGAEGAIDNGDVLIMSEDIRRLPLAMRLAGLTAGIARQNICMVLAVKLLILIFGFFGLMPVLVAAIGDTAVFILALLNSLRIFLYKNKEEQK